MPITRKIAKREIKSETSSRPMDRKELGEHVAKLISNERNSTHGDPHVQFSLAQKLKTMLSEAIDNHNNAGGLGDTESEALGMITLKLSRIVCGANLQDHWLDIAGYALIAAEGAEKPLIKETE